MEIKDQFTNEISVIANLCNNINSLDFIDDEILIKLGNMLRNLLDKKKGIDSYFLNNPKMEDIEKSECYVLSEIKRLEIKFHQESNG